MKVFNDNANSVLEENVSWIEFFLISKKYLSIEG